MEHTVEVCPTWVGTAITSWCLSQSALVQAMLLSENAWKTVTASCEALMLAQEEAEA